MVYTSRIRGNVGRRPQAFWGSLIPAAINFVGGLITTSQQAKAQKKALEEQQRLAQQQLEVSNQNNLAATLNNYANAQNSYDDTNYNLKYRNGGTRRLGSNGIIITDGGNARKIGNNTFLLRGGSHEDINETGQTGIGINVGGNEIEAEGGEVAQKKNKSLRIFSAQPMLSGGLSPAQAILRGYNKDKVFAAQQRFKKNNHLNDDGSKFRGGGKPTKAKRVIVGSDGVLRYKSPFTPNNGQAKSMGITSPEFQILMGLRGLNIPALRAASEPIKNAIRGKGFNLSKEYPDLKSGLLEYVRQFQGIVNPFMRYGGKTYTKPNYYHWMHQTSNNLKVSPIDSTYDYRAYYDSATPWELANTMYNAKNGHFTDIGKRSSHPTFSNESKYSNSKTPGGNWDGNVFVPSIWQFNNNSNKIRNKYMNNTGEGYFNGKRNVFPRSKYGLGGVKIGSNIGINTNTNIPDYNSAYINWLISQLSSEKDEQQVANYNQEDIDNAVNAANLAYQNYLIRQLPSGKSNKQENSKTTKYITTDGLKRNTQSVVDASRRSVDFASNTYRSKLISQLPNKQDKTTPQYNDKRSLKDKTQSIVNATRFAVDNAIKYRNSKLISQLPNKQNSKQNNKVAKKKASTPQYKGNVTKGNYQLHDGESKVINGIKYTRMGNTIINHKTNVGYIYDKNGNYTGQADYSKVGKNFNDAFDAARAAGRSQFIYRAGKYNNYSTAKEEDAKKEALNRRYGARRIAKRFGGLEHARRRAVNGTDINLNEVDVTARNRRKFNDWNDYMINSVLNNITTPNVSYQKTPNTSRTQSYLDLSTTPYLGRQNTFKPATQDYIGLGIDTLAALGSGLFTRSAYNKLNFDYNLPSYVDETPVAFDTTYHNEAQRANVERNRINGRNLIQGNTASAQTSLARMQEGDTNAMMELNKLADEKANKEVELRNQNAANEQQVRARNAAARNQYYQSVAQIQNAALEAKNNAALAKAQSIGADLSGLSQAWTNFAGSVENRYNARQNEAIIAATSKEPAVLSNALQFGYNFSPEVLASIYRSTNDDKLKQLALSRLSPSDRRRYSLFQ